MRLFPVLLTGLLLAAAAPALAQKGDPTSVPILGDLPLVGRLFQKDTLPVSVREKTEKKVREQLERRKVSLELKAADPQQALQTLFEQLEVDYSFDRAFYPLGRLDLHQPELNLKITHASGAKALDAITQALGIGWWADTVDGRLMVHIAKLRDTLGQQEMLARLGVDVNQIVAPSVVAAADAVRAADLAILAGARLPEVRVNMNAATPREVRALIEDLCKQAGLVYAIDSDVPATSKALVFENVPLRIALDVLCATANLSMRVSHKGEKGERVVVQFSQHLEDSKKE